MMTSDQTWLRFIIKQKWILHVIVLTIMNLDQIIKNQEKKVKFLMLLMCKKLPGFKKKVSDTLFFFMHVMPLCNTCTLTLCTSFGEKKRLVQNMRNRFQTNFILLKTNNYNWYCAIFTNNFFMVSYIEIKKKIFQSVYWGQWWWDK